jgi:hypothetical protein
VITNCLAYFFKLNQNRRTRNELGELKLECLKVMFDIEYDITPEEMTANDEYATRLTNIMGSINRALARIDAVNKLAIKPNVTHEYEQDIEMCLLKRLPNNLSDDTDLKEEHGLAITY